LSCSTWRLCTCEPGTAHQHPACVLQCVAVRCIVLQRVAESCSTWLLRPSPRNSANFVHTTHCNTRPTPHTTTHGNTRPNRYRQLLHTTYHNTRLAAVHTTHCNTRPNTLPDHCNILQRSTLQYTATHCKIQCVWIQHTAIHIQTMQRHCNILQHTATHCNILQHAATQKVYLALQIIIRQHTATVPSLCTRSCTNCSMLQCIVVRCSVLLCTAV